MMQQGLQGLTYRSANKKQLFICLFDNITCKNFFSCSLFGGWNEWCRGQLLRWGPPDSRTASHPWHFLSAAALPPKHSLCVFGVVGAGDV